MNDDAISRSAEIKMIRDCPYRLGVVDYNDAELCAEKLVCLETLAAVRHELDRLPAIDAVPVVRCKDCKYAMPITNPLILKAFGGCVRACSIWRGSLCAGLSIVYLNEYCSDGARMDGE